MTENTNTVPENITIEDHAAPAIILDEDGELKGFGELDEVEDGGEQ